MSGTKESFKEYRKVPPSRRVRIANGNTIQIAGKGVKAYSFTQNMSATTLYVPELGRTSLFSISKAVRGGNQFTFTEQGCGLFSEKGKILATGRLQDNLYIMNTTSQFSHGSFVTLVKPDMLKLWHYRLGHRNARDIVDMKNNDLAQGMTLDGSFAKSPCVDCSTHKAKKRPFPKSRDERGRQLLDVLHSDLCGPLPSTSLEGARYFVVR
jgi:hypothetical protein